MVEFTLKEKINQTMGILCTESEILLMTPSETGRKISRKTKYLDLVTNVKVESVKNDQSFKSGMYNLLVLKDMSDQGIVDLFEDLCKLYGSSHTMTLEDFFLNLCDIFSDNKFAHLSDEIGLMGELIFMKELISSGLNNPVEYWNYSSTHARIDFSFENVSIEVKSTTRQNLSFLLKQSQISNSENTYLYLVSLEEVKKGLTIRGLVDDLCYHFNYKEELQFRLNIGKVIDLDVLKNKERNFRVHNIKIVSVEDVSMIENIPDCISEISYRYNFENTPELSMKQLKELISN